MEVTAMHFRRKAAESLENAKLQHALKKMQSKFVDKRAAAITELPNFTEIRDAATDIRERVVNHLDSYLLRFEQEATARGAVVHWAEDIEEANRIVVEIAQRHGVRKVVKSKSMVTEECALNDYLASVGVEVLETDLGEYILQLAHEPPSHIVAPVVHKSKEEIADLFAEKHKRTRKTEITEMCREAREVLRPGFLSADMGISGANFIIAETGSVLIVTNEGNGRLTTTLPRVHVAITGIEKVVPTLEDASTLLRLLPRSATGQPITNYVSVLTGIRGQDESDGPEHFHIILLDNGRSRLLGTELQPMLRCIRCGACMNHCPVYQNIGGHAYGWVYPGPMGSVLTPSFVGLENAIDLPNASTFCGECAVVCPVKIPLPDLMRHLRHQQVVRHLRPWTERVALRLWSWAARHPAVYALLTRAAVRLLCLLGGKEKRLRHLPGASGWTKGRDMPAPAGRTFRELYQARRSL
ncbi:MAG: LutB/LldF family L-lactate oxidation iron-sulfur protein [Sulfuricaulis sp.]|uniref:LutB/LldF family L-lactate oxidation iron-sulfur protein n=1 Tax=Sulfuricaulis sp. TaxID=2003553 RepID=UPI0025E4FAB6|nr:LutB/LldF family L-lactate oxidation iron-sulfur protein [Sulfuricaulis sp.]MCR4347511.1 LutB/LldF family L-lactate oxidation iron-sulfur protein [Sulfuricaulis sp.]